MRSATSSRLSAAVGPVGEGAVPQPHGRRADGRARLVGQRPAPDVVEPGARLDGEGALPHPLFFHLPGEEGGALAALGDPERDRQGERRLADADVAAQHDEVALPEAPAEDPVHAREAGGHGVAARRAAELGVHALDDVGDGIGAARDVGEGMRSGRPGGGAGGAGRGLHRFG